MLAVEGATGFSAMQARLGRYTALLNRLSAADAAHDATRRSELEVSLRTEGAQLINEAQEMISRERVAVMSMLHTSAVAAVGFLALMLLVMVLFGGFVIRAVVRPLDRFMEYVTRIGAGNYEPIRPARRYRDEFTKLAFSFNRMLGEIRARQEQLVQSTKMAAVGTLTSGIAHELNNPLNNIGLTTEALLEDFESYGDDERHRMLEQIYTQVERASTTVKNLLDFTRKDRSAFTTLDLPDAVRSALRLVSNEALLGGVSWSLDLDGTAPQVRGNPHDLQQVFVNLFLNAIQAMPDGGEITVRCHANGAGCVHIDVGDIGVGIEPEHLEEIFDPFFTTKKPGEGTGLGLSVSRSIIEKHGGRITVVSEPDKGTTFSVHLPTTEGHN
jgi:two-component system, NtrC family, sensor kinase